MDDPAEPWATNQYEGAGLQSEVLARRTLSLLGQRTWLCDRPAGTPSDVSRDGAGPQEHAERLGEHLSNRAERGRTGADSPMRLLWTAGVLSLTTIAARAIPAPEAALFGEGVISTPADEVGMALSPDGKDAYF